MLGSVSGTVSARWAAVLAMLVCVSESASDSVSGTVSDTVSARWAALLAV